MDGITLYMLMQDQAYILELTHFYNLVKIYQKMNYLKKIKNSILY
jgi:hypothetical protein